MTDRTPSFISPPSPPPNRGGQVRVVRAEGLGWKEVPRVRRQGAQGGRPAQAQLDAHDGEMKDKR
jgi:hypothetical protein